MKRARSLFVAMSLLLSGSALADWQGVLDWSPYIFHGDGEKSELSGGFGGLMYGWDELWSAGFGIGAVSDDKDRLMFSGILGLGPIDVGVKFDIWQGGEGIPIIERGFDPFNRDTFGIVFAVRVYGTGG